MARHAEQHMQFRSMTDTAVRNTFIYEITWERPVGQLAQAKDDPAPVDAENVPALQPVHVLEPLAAGTLEYVPGGQPMHKLTALAATAVW